jgi:hypothetical protein
MECTTHIHVLSLDNLHKCTMIPHSLRSHRPTEFSYRNLLNESIIGTSFLSQNILLPKLLIVFRLHLLLMDLYVKLSEKFTFGSIDF